MRSIRLLMIMLLTVAALGASCSRGPRKSATVPFVLDHNRILVDADIQRADGSWRKTRLWVDTGNPVFMLSPDLASDLGIDPEKSASGKERPAIAGMKLGGMALDLSGVPLMIMPQPFWLYSEMNNEGNLPSTLLSKYQVVFDYHDKKLTIGQPGSIKPRGTRIPAGVDPESGIAQIDAVVGDDSMSLAIDIGASYTFISSSAMGPVLSSHPNLPKMNGTAGCANMWGWWPPGEETFVVSRLPSIAIGGVTLDGVAAVMVPGIYPSGSDLGDWYSQKTLGPVAGFIGPNAFTGCRMLIDYPANALYLDKCAGADQKGEQAPHDMDIVPLTLRPEADGSITVIGIPDRDGVPFVRDVEIGDKLIKIDGEEIAGKTFGAVVDALRGKPGDTHKLELERKGKRVKVKENVTRAI